MLFNVNSPPIMGFLEYKLFVASNYSSSDSALDLTYCKPIIAPTIPAISPAISYPAFAIVRAPFTGKIQKRRYY
jgi:hypothetical protein